MATYLELHGLRADSDLRYRVQVATWIAAEAIRVEDPATANHTNRVIWAKQVLGFADQHAEQMLCAVLAANHGLTVAQITGASDAAIQSAVNAAVDLVALGV